MDKAYHWIGAIVFWGVIVIVVGYILMVLLHYIWKAMKEGFRGTWLWCYLDYKQLQRKILNPKTKLEGNLIWHYLHKFKVGWTKHAFQDEITTLLISVINMPGYERLLRGYNDTESGQKQYRVNYLYKRGWTQIVIREKGIDGWEAPNRDPEELMDIWNAYSFQLLKEKEEDAQIQEQEG